ncbi:hypothetical protein P7B02_19465 [Caulobacter segnis]|uniref:hypothetical protein n=1 Tax=Caulobacter segnis TaxID=88688 RepID=UPI00240EFF3C|nr:hypothetical protein [Caulobacter segnis]MDG2523713.1 hypothetical protein [Caulobacter segnis]
MTDATMSAVRAKAPWHLWVVGVLSLCWNAFGGFDYIMTQIGDDQYLAALTAEQRAYVAGLPVVMEAAWTIGVWGGVAGSLLLLMRTRWAVHAFAISLAAMIVSFAYGNLVLHSADIMGPSAIYMPAVITLIGVLLAWYAWAMRKRGVLG